MYFIRLVIDYFFTVETVVFLYIGMQVFAIRTSFRVELIIWSLILILVGRAANIFPLSFLVNRFRSVKISSRMQFIMWFSGEYIGVWCIWVGTIWRNSIY